MKIGRDGSMSDKRLDRIQGSLLAGAAGDALGYAVEFMGEEELFHHFGKSGITEYSLSITFIG